MDLGDEGQEKTEGSFSKFTDQEEQ